jgi:hypothetical protein
VHGVNSTNEDKIEQLASMGWDRASASLALNATDHDLEQAAMLLDEEQTNKEEISALAAELCSKSDWGLEVSEAAIAQANKNVTEAVLMLEQEERIINENFETAVQDMIGKIGRLHDL